MKNMERKKKEYYKKEQLGDGPFSIPRYNVSLSTCIQSVNFLCCTVVKVSDEKIWKERKKTNREKTNRKQPILNPTKQLVIVNCEVSIVNGFRQIFDEKLQP